MIILRAKIHIFFKIQYHSSKKPAIATGFLITDTVYPHKGTSKNYVFPSLRGTKQSRKELCGLLRAIALAMTLGCLTANASALLQEPLFATRIPAVHNRLRPFSTGYHR